MSMETDRTQEQDEAKGSFGRTANGGIEAWRFNEK